jgi:hypothetical protein
MRGEENFQRRSSGVTGGEFLTTDYTDFGDLERRDTAPNTGILL